MTKTPLATSSFTYWVKYEQGEPKEVDKEELKDYQSDYVRCWNYITDRGWSRKDKHWVSPDGKEKYSSVYQAYRVQLLKEQIGL